MLNISHLRKQYSSVLAVDDVSFHVDRGQILGLLGPNGAGKTTTIRMILNIIQPDSGSITFHGRSFNDSIRNTIGYLPEERGLYRKSKLINAILYFSSLRGVDAGTARKKALHWLERFNLSGYAERKVEELSKGNQQKVQFIISVLHEPELVILDEPFSGLDPINQNLLKDFLLELKQQGRAVIFSTHQMDQAERICDSIALINAGRVVLDGELQEVKRRYGKNAVQLEFEGDGSFLRSHPAVKHAHVYENFAELVLTSGDRSVDILQEAVSRLRVRRFELVQPSLHSIFIELVGGTKALASQEKLEAAQ